MNKVLNVNWSNVESETYYVDKDEYSVVHEHQTYFVLNSFSGHYYFYKDTKEIVLNDGARD